MFDVANTWCTYSYTQVQPQRGRMFMTQNWQKHEYNIHFSSICYWSARNSFALQIAILMYHVNFFSENSRFQVCYLIPSKRKLNEYLNTQRKIFTFRECLNLNNFNKSLFSVCTLACQNDWHLWCRQSFHLVNWFRTSLTWNCYAENGEKGYSNPSYSFLQTTKDKKWFFLSMLLNSYAGMKISNKTEMWPSFLQYFRPLCFL